MKICDRNGNVFEENSKMDRLIGDIYSSPVSRVCLKVLTSPFVSRAAGLLLNSKISAPFAYYYADKHGINLYDFEACEYTSFNDFFTRKIKPGRRSLPADKNALVCPCDGKVSVRRIAATDMFVIKNSVYSVSSLLRDRKLGEKYCGGAAVIIRLTPDDYHRYIYPASGVKSHNRKISGTLNTVRPIINKYEKVYSENSREYCLIRTEAFGDIVQMEVGALIVGKITNHERGISDVTRGEEKGYFEFGGSTVILLLEADKVSVCSDLIEATNRGFETKLRQGEIIGYSNIQ